MRQDDPAESAIKRLVEVARCEERDLYLALAERERQRESPAFGQPLVQDLPGDTPARRQQRYFAALERQAQFHKLIREKNAEEFERLAVAVMRDGPFGEFGGPTSSEISRDVLSGTGGGSVFRSQLEKYRPRHDRYARDHPQPMPPLPMSEYGAPSTIWVSTPDGLKTIHRISDDYYWVAPSLGK